MKKLLIFLFITISISSCDVEGCTNKYALNYNPKAELDNCSCIGYADAMEGVYKITITSCPGKISQEGNELRTLVFKAHTGCESSTQYEFNSIRFHSLFTSGTCDWYPLDKFTFTVALKEYEDWGGAKIEGTGTIKKGVFHFEGTMHTSAGQFPIVLEGIKTSDLIDTVSY